MNLVTATALFTTLTPPLLLNLYWEHSGEARFLLRNEVGTLNIHPRGGSVAGVHAKIIEQRIEMRCQTQRLTVPPQIARARIRGGAEVAAPRMLNSRAALTVPRTSCASISLSASRKPTVVRLHPRPLTAGRTARCA